MLLAAKTSTTEVLLWSGALIVLVIGTGLVILAMRRMMLSKGGGGGEAGLFDSLREMKKTGAISPEEYEAARRNMVARAAGQMGGGAAPVSPQAGKDVRLSKTVASGEVRARPGFDLTGRPLPKPDGPPGNTK